MTDEKTAGEILGETFDAGYKALMSYCEWVMENQIKLDIHDKLMGKEQPDFTDQGIPTMNLTLDL